MVRAPRRFLAGLLSSPWTQRDAHIQVLQQKERLSASEELDKNAMRWPSDRPDHANDGASGEASRIFAALHRFHGFKDQLRTQPCDRVLIGGGVVGDPAMSYFMEQIVRGGCQHVEYGE